MNKENYKIYCLTSPDGRKYIGCTSLSLKRRFANGKRYGGRMQKYINENGWEILTKELVRDGLTKDEAFELEIELISKYNSTDERYGFNMSTGGKNGSKGVVYTEERRKKISARLTGRKMSYEGREKLRKFHNGRHLTEESKEKIRQANLGKKYSDATREKHRLAGLGNSYAKGNKLSIETRAKMSASRMGHKASEKTKLRVSQVMSKPIICIETGEIYKSSADASIKLNIPRYTFANHFRGMNSNINGLHYKRLEAE